MNIIPTNEQVALIQEASKGSNLCVRAFAGAAKSSSCILIAEAIQKPSLYIAFMKNNAEEAKGKFPSHVDCMTVNSLAWRAVIKRKGTLYDKKLKPFFNYQDIPDIYPGSEDANMEAKVLVITIIKEYCQSAMREISDFISYWEKVSDRELTSVLKSAIYAFWKAVSDENNPVGMTHDVYLKLYQLRKPRLAYKIIYVDETQDSNTVTLDIVFNQLQYDTQVILVGDSYQCLPAGTIVDGKPIEDIQVGDNVKSFVGGQLVTAKVSKTYKKEVDTNLIRITTAEGIIDSTRNHTHFVQELPIKHGYVVYLMYKKGTGYRIGCTQQFRQRCSGEGATYCWILKTFGDNKVEARVYEQITAFTYGIPTLVFKPRNTTNEFPQEYFDKIFAGIDTYTKAKKLLLDNLLDINMPHYIPQAVASDSVTFTITLLGDARNLAKPYNKYSVIMTTAQGDLVNHKYPEYNLRDTCKNNGTVRLEGVSADLGKCYSMYNDLKTVLPHIELRELANISEGRSLSLCAAGNIVPGMMLQNLEGDLLEVLHVESVPYKGYVYDLDVDTTHNFIANGIVTHNSIYAWRGAVNAFDHVPKGFVNMYLTESFRFTQDIADMATKLTSLVGNTKKIIGKRKANSVDKTSKCSKVVIVRNNSTMLEHLLRAEEEGLKVYCLTDLKDLWGKLYHIQALKFNTTPKYADADLKQYKTWGTLCQAAESLPELNKLINLTSQLTYKDSLHNSIAKIKSVILTEAEKDKADFHLTTVHKSKGLQWREVIISEDILPKDLDTNELIELLTENKNEELHCTYVALTRAQEVVVLPEKLQSILQYLPDCA